MIERIWKSLFMAVLAPIVFIVACLGMVLVAGGLIVLPFVVFAYPDGFTVNKWNVRFDWGKK